jgi:hypothetical protein
MTRAKRIYGYLAEMKDAVIRIRVDEPDLSGLSEQDFDWSKSVYGDVKEIIASDKPEALGNCVTLFHYYDANLYHDLTTGRSVTGVIHLFNKTPVEWYSKKQATVETATYGSEFIAAQTCVDQILDLHTYLRYLEVPIREYSYVFLGIIRQLLMVLHFHMPSYTNATMHYPSTVYVKLWHLDS